MAFPIEKVLCSFANDPRLFQDLVKNSASNDQCKLFSPLHLKVPLTPKTFLARNKSLCRTEKDSAKISSFGLNLDRFLKFKVSKKRPHLKNYLVKKLSN